MVGVAFRLSAGARLRSVAVAGLLLLVSACGSPAVFVTGLPGVTPATPPPAGRVLWTGDATTGDLSQYQKTPWNIVAGDPPAVVPDPDHEKKASIRFSIGGTSSTADGICCGSRAEILPAFPDLREGDDLYFRFSTMLAPGFPTDAVWQVITQFKQNFDGSPPLSLNVEQGQYRVEGGYGYPGGSRQFIANLGEASTGVWVSWVMHVKFSTDPRVGFVELWKDGAVALSRYFPPGGTLYPGPNGVDASYVKTGLYRDPTIDQRGTIYFADWSIDAP
jgi:hypothetical protein